MMARSVITRLCNRPHALRMLAVALAFVALIAPTAAFGKNPPPEFTWYKIPNPLNPGPRQVLFAYIDVAMLLVMLGLTAYYALRARSRAHLRLLSVFAVLYFGFYRHGCVCAVGSVQNVALALGGNGYALPFSVGAFFVLPLVFALFFGRAFCASVCPLGAAQEVLLIKPRRVPPAWEHALSVVPYLYLGLAFLFAFTGSAFIICKYDPIVPFFRLGGPALMVTLGAAILLLSTVIGRPYCRFLCPYSVLLRWMAPFTKWQVKVTPSECIKCHLCADACPYGAIKPPTPETPTVARLDGKQMLTRQVLALPVLMLVLAGVGYLSAPALSRMHPTVVLAERVWAEDQGRVKGDTDQSRAFRNTEKSAGELYGEAYDIRHKFNAGGALFGAYAGLVIGLKLISLTIRRRRTEYEADPAACYACGRCYSSCPVEQARITGQPIPLELLAGGGKPE